jgi:small-conductance mechanosensitive channel
MFENTAVDVFVAIEKIIPLMLVLVVIGILLLISRLLLISIRRRLIQKARNKRQISDIKIFSRIFNVVIFCLISFIAFFSYIGSWSGLGIFAGLITAGLGFALQKPITGVAAWLMVVIKRPFSVGDRIKIGDIKGDVYDITLTHVYIDETGGIADTEDVSGRNVMVPNYKLFEGDIINYTLMNDLIIGEIVVSLTFGSNAIKAMNITKSIVDKHAKIFAEQMQKSNKVRLNFRDNGFNLKILFYAPVQKISRIKSDIATEVLESLRKEKDIDFPAPDGSGIVHKKK